jgi:hypothetical protein
MDDETEPPPKLERVDEMDESGDADEAAKKGASSERCC